MGKVILSGKGRRWVLGGHQWIYRDDIAGGEAAPGELLPVEDPNQKVLGWGLFSASSRIAVRLVTRDAAQPKRPFWAERVAHAIAVRERAGLMDPAGACRLIAGDADGIPGFIVDRYADTLVIQSGTQSADEMRDFLLELIDEKLPFPAKNVLDRSDSSTRRHESLDPRVELLRGSVDAPIEISEGDLQYEVDVQKGHKTGAYLDQRDNRRVAAREVEGKRVLDAFSYDGLFGIRCALAGAREVLCIDQSAGAGERLLRNAERNGVSDRVRFEKANAMTDLKRRQYEKERYDLVIVDPPAFARNRRELQGAERGYVELNRRALALAEPGGRVVTASCSYNVRPEAFTRFLARASNEAGRHAYLEELRGAGSDHPALLTLPETAYLKCAFLRVE